MPSQFADILLHSLQLKKPKKATSLPRTIHCLKKIKPFNELSVLCDAEVALIIFSNRGKLYEFCSGSSMTKTLEKYKKCSYVALDTNCSIHEMQNNYQEYLKLKTRVEVLQKCQRNLLGEDLAPLDSKELEQLENQLEISLKEIRSTKTQFMIDQLADLQNKEQMLLETNRALRRKLDEMNARPGFHFDSLGKGTINATTLLMTGCLLILIFNRKDSFIPLQPIPLFKSGIVPWDRMRLL